MMRFNPFSKKCGGCGEPKSACGGGCSHQKHPHGLTRKVYDLEEWKDEVAAYLVGMEEDLCDRKFLASLIGGEKEDELECDDLDGILGYSECEGTGFMSKAKFVACLIKDILADICTNSATRAALLECLLQDAKGNEADTKCKRARYVLAIEGTPGDPNDPCRLAVVRPDMGDALSSMAFNESGVIDSSDEVEIACYETSHSCDEVIDALMTIERDLINWPPSQADKDSVFAISVKVTDATGALFQTPFYNFHGGQLAFSRENSFTGVAAPANSKVCICAKRISGTGTFPYGSVNFGGNLY